MLLASVLGNSYSESGVLRLFDTFDGSASELDPRYDVPYAKRDDRGMDEVAQSSIDAVRRRLEILDALDAGRTFFHPGLIPKSFAGLESSRIALAHIDVNYHQAVWDSCCFISDRLVPSGIMIFDDYGYSSCPGARRAVDDFFSDKPEEPFISPTAQAIIFKIGPSSPAEDE